MGRNVSRHAGSGKCCNDLKLGTTSPHDAAPGTGDPMCTVSTTLELWNSVVCAVTASKLYVDTISVVSLE